MNPFFVSTISAHQFRNLESFKISTHPSLNILFGRNGQGKTNIIEAISVGLSTKALRPVKQVSDLILHGQEQGRIAIKCEGESYFDTVLELSAKGKKIELSGKAIKDSQALLSKVAVVSFVPEELQIVSASSSFRRRALNQIAAGFFPAYPGLYRKFERALASRNQLLKSPYCDPQELAAFDQVYEKLASEVTGYREEAVLLWQPYFLSSIKDIVSTRFSVDVRYAPSASCSSHDERLRRVTLHGPHLDDLIFFIDGTEARFLASRGQARAIVLALKLGQLNAIAELRKTPTVLLLDDVAGELDPEKVSFLMSTVSRLGIQTFLTTTHLGGLFDFANDCATFEIEQGSVKKCLPHMQAL